MRFLLDQGLPRSTVDLLVQIGFEAAHVGELGMATASDSDILAEAIRRRAVVVTLDADFHSILVRTGASMPSVIRVRSQAPCIRASLAGPTGVISKPYEGDAHSQSPPGLVE